MCKRSEEDLGCSLETDSGPMVVQCNASNKHGYVFANGYLNVLGALAARDRYRQVKSYRFIDSWVRLGRVIFLPTALAGVSECVDLYSA